MKAPVRVASIHDAPPIWRWLEPIYTGSPEVEWRSISTHRSPLLKRLPGPHLGRIRAAAELRWLLARGRTDFIVSHGPYTSLYVELFGRGRHREVPHLAFAFNFTDLPSGRTLNAMRRAFARIDRFVVYSRIERDLYAELFGVPANRFHFLRWGVAPPISEPGPREVGGQYVAALGGEARDYATLCAAARRLPHRSFVLITRPDSLNGIEVPENVTVHTNLPWDRAWSILWHSDVVALPLRSKETPNGHVTAVGAMHLGKAQAITDSAGIRDYFIDGQTALLVPALDPVAFATSLERALKDQSLRQRLGDASRAFAQTHCIESVTVEFFRAQLVEMLRSHSPGRKMQ